MIWITDVQSASFYTEIAMLTIKTLTDDKFVLVDKSNMENELTKKK